MNHQTDTARADALYARAQENLLAQSRERVILEGLNRELAQLHKEFGDLFEDRDGVQTIPFGPGHLTMHQRSVSAVDQDKVEGLRNTLGAEMFDELFYTSRIGRRLITIPRSRCLERMSSADDPVGDDVRGAVTVDRQREFLLHRPGCACGHVHNQVPQSKES